MKIEEQVLSREQMAHLKELGVDTSDASMVWVNRKSKIGGDFYYLYPNTQFTRDMLEISDDISYYFNPTYTVNDLIEKLPVNIVDSGEFVRHILIDRGYIEVGYSNDGNHCPIMYYNTPLLESLYCLLCWVAENKMELIK